MTLMMDEVAKSQAKYGDFTSTHEAYGVLAEEVKELLDAIHLYGRESIHTEAVQVAAVAYRLALQLHAPSEAFILRSGFSGK